MAGRFDRLRARVVRALPPRRTPHHARQNPEIKGGPYGFRPAELGTFPAAGCPVTAPRDEGG
ncbi:hypothetical protein [Kitasatospora sp. LaBMicrA B282]|uniref:hypothetical protein n=1 Tax=Kitasatospora sp. LaBMicrA B282 TaxID=3420949 RepID=UPI003D0A9C90